MRCLIFGLLVHGLARRSMDISANNWYQSFTHGLLARPEAAQRLTWWNAYGSTVYSSGARAEHSAAQGKIKRYKHLVEAVGELFFPLGFFHFGRVLCERLYLIEAHSGRGQRKWVLGPYWASRHAGSPGGHYCPL